MDLIDGNWRIGSRTDITDNLLSCQLVLPTRMFLQRVHCSVASAEPQVSWSSCNEASKLAAYLTCSFLGPCVLPCWLSAGLKQRFDTRYHAIETTRLHKREQQRQCFCGQLIYSIPNWNSSLPTLIRRFAVTCRMRYSRLYIHCRGDTNNFDAPGCDLEIKHILPVGALCLTVA